MVHDAWMLFFSPCPRLMFWCFVDCTQACTIPLHCPNPHLHTHTHTHTPNHTQHTHTHTDTHTHTHTHTHRQKGVVVKVEYRRVLSVSVGGVRPLDAGNAAQCE